MAVCPYWGGGWGGGVDGWEFWEGWKGESGECMVKKLVRTYRELEVYQAAFWAAMEIFELSKKFPVEERYSLTDQMRRSSRSVCANLGEAWRKRRYQAAFVAKLSDCQAEATETQIWIEFAVKCNYLDIDTGRNLYKTYNQITGQLVNMVKHSSHWTIQ
jgi:four helix bundle protein